MLNAVSGIKNHKLPLTEKELSNVTMLCFEKKIVFYEEISCGKKKKFVKEMENSKLIPSLSK